jgi:hypothetical protein
MLTPFSPLGSPEQTWRRRRVHRPQLQQLEPAQADALGADAQMRQANVCAEGFDSRVGATFHLLATTGRTGTTRPAVLATWLVLARSAR